VACLEIYWAASGEEEIAMNEQKIIFSGPVGVGKTTAIRSISDIDPVVTDVEPTVAMDYGMISLNNQARIHLYGTTGQEDIDSLGGILNQNALGLILLVSNTKPDPFSDIRLYLNTFKDFIKRTQVVIGVTQMDLSNKPRLEDYYLQLEDSGLKIPLFEVDPRNKQDISLLLEALLYSIDPGLEG
jgi:signal recognition particle receptor subunit beta